jgi:carnitine 3-dehydrogenase
MALEPLSGGIGVVGTNVIGASWAAYFLAKGFDVAATDPAEEQRNVCGHLVVME